MNGRFNVSYNDINELAFPVLRHRMKLTFEAVAERISADDIVGMIVNEMIDRTGISAEKIKIASEAVKEAEAEDKKRGKHGRK